MELYLEDVLAAGDEQKFIPRPAAMEEWLKFFNAEAKFLAKELSKSTAKKLKFEEIVYG